MTDYQLNNDKFFDYIFKNGLTIDTFAVKFNVTPITVHRWLKGDSVPSFNRLSQMSKKSGVNLFRLLERREKSNVQTPQRTQNQRKTK